MKKQRDQRSFPEVNNDDKLISAIENMMDSTFFEDGDSLGSIVEKLRDLGHIIPGEEPKKLYSDVQVCLVGGFISSRDHSKIITSTILITNFNIIMLECYGEEREILHSVPMGTIHRIAPKKKTKSVLEINAKDGRCILVVFKKKQDSMQAIEIITRYAFPTSCHQLFAYVHKMIVGFSDSNAKSSSNNAPFYFETDKDYIRQGFYDCEDLRFSAINFDFSICPTYPKLLFVPNSVTDADLKEIAVFRSKGRIPAVVWRHPLYGGLLVRCAQPNVGIHRARSLHDERYLSELKMPHQEKLYIIDSRPKANAVANMLRGGGFENPKVYKDIEIEFSDIENIHVIRNSLNAIFKACQSASPVNLNEFKAQIDESKWLLHLRLILESVVRVMQLMEKGFSVLVHCSDGWDRTSQTTATCELLMDPYYRRIEGFIILIEREWLQFGHQFALRYGHGENMSNYKESQRSPIFPQWIDLVFQLLELFPKNFEFNEELLFFILEELYSCKYGTFLFNSVKERIDNNVYSNTASCWEYVVQNIERFQNPNFVEKKGTLVPKTSKPLRLWSSLYLRYKGDDLKSLAIYENPEQISTHLNPKSEDGFNNQAQVDDLIFNSAKSYSATGRSNSPISPRSPFRSPASQRKGSMDAKSQASLVRNAVHTSSAPPNNNNNGPISASTVILRGTKSKHNKNKKVTIEQINFGGPKNSQRRRSGSFIISSTSSTPDVLPTLDLDAIKADTPTSESQGSPPSSEGESEKRISITQSDNILNLPRSRVTRSNSISDLLSRFNETQSKVDDTNKNSSPNPLYDPDEEDYLNSVPEEEDDSSEEDNDDDDDELEKAKLLNELTTVGVQPVSIPSINISSNNTLVSSGNQTSSGDSPRVEKTNSMIFKELVNNDSALSKKDKRKARLVTPNIVNVTNNIINREIGDSSNTTNLSNDSKTRAATLSTTVNNNNNSSGSNSNQNYFVSLTDTKAKRHVSQAPTKLKH